MSLPGRVDATQSRTKAEPILGEKRSQLSPYSAVFAESGIVIPQGGQRFSSSSRKVSCKPRLGGRVRSPPPQDPGCPFPRPGKAQERPWVVLALLPPLGFDPGLWRGCQSRFPQSSFQGSRDRFSGSRGRRYLLHLLLRLTSLSLRNRIGDPETSPSPLQCTDLCRFHNKGRPARRPLTVVWGECSTSRARSGVLRLAWSTLADKVILPLVKVI